jgi:hypothetical protein
VNYIQDTTELAATNKESLWTFDPATLDTLAEILAEQLRIPLDAAQRVAAWHLARLDEHHAEVDSRAGGVCLHRILAWLLAAGDAKAKTVALCFAADIQGLIGWDSLAEAAREINTTAANLSKLQTEIQAWLQLPETQWNKTKYRVKACRVPNTKEIPTVERVAQGFRRWVARVNVDAMTSAQKATVRKSLAEITTFVSRL